MRTSISAVCAILLFGSTWLTSGATSDQQSIRALDQQYIKAFNAKDLNQMMATFSDDAVYNTDYGETLRGKNEIQAAMKEQLEDAGESTLELKIYSIDVKPDGKTATEKGVSIVTTDGIEEPSSYIAEFKKEGDKWLVSKVIEQTEAASTEYLKPLGWMVGDWNDQSEDVSVRTKTEWSLDRAFIIRRFAVQTPGRREMKGIEYIGWDPIRSQIHSWYFDSEGGFGNGSWRQEGGRWVEEAVGITPRGEKATATQIFTPKDSDTFTWQSINRQVGGEKQDDVEEITIKRMKQDALSDASRGQQ